ncbi:hypothetical protein [Capnocytophaga catalasegens]|uniref:hypothetical protein n=1 Tax=Capnocytophaga catalasegens TaxID=1004260 RepID=UPI00222F4A61|nr:hypothetical protein [Capnocytophaga catalasegens]
MKKINRGIAKYVGAYSIRLYNAQNTQMRRKHYAPTKKCKTAKNKPYEQVFTIQRKEYLL